MMKNTSYATSAASVKEPIPQKLVDWLKSDSGRSAVETAVSSSLKTVESLNEARKVRPEQLNAPITL
jgi:hypothetical protein